MEIVFIIIAVLIAIIVIWFISGYNGFIKAKNQVEEGFSTMDVYLKKRYDLSLIHISLFLRQHLE